MTEIYTFSGKLYRIFERSYKKIRDGLDDFLYPVDAVFISFPKSGRTWVRLFLSCYYSNFINKNLELDLESKEILGVLPRIRFKHGSYFGHQDSQNSFKKINEKLAKTSKKHKLIYLKRDPRDVFVSFFHHLTKREIPNDNSVDFKSISIDELILNEKYGFRNIWNYNKYWDSIFSSHMNAYMLNYEELLNDPEVGYFNLLKFLELDIRKELIADAIYETSFDKLKEKYANSSNHRLKQINPKDNNSSKFRTGKSGSYLSELSEDSIKLCNKIMET